MEQEKPEVLPEFHKIQYPTTFILVLFLTWWNQIWLNYTINSKNSPLHDHQRQCFLIRELISLSGTLKVISNYKVQTKGKFHNSSSALPNTKE